MSRFHFVVGDQYGRARANEEEDLAAVHRSLSSESSNKQRRGIRQHEGAPHENQKTQSRHRICQPAIHKETPFFGFQFF